MHLTEEQRQRIARNRAEAQRRRAAALAKTQPSVSAGFNGSEPSTSSRPLQVTAVISGNPGPVQSALVQRLLSNKAPSDLPHRTPAQTLANPISNRPVETPRNDQLSLSVRTNSSYSYKPQAIVSYAPLDSFNTKKDIKVTISLRDSRNFYVSI